MATKNATAPAPGGEPRRDALDELNALPRDLRLAAEVASVRVRATTSEALRAARGHDWLLDLEAVTVAELAEMIAGSIERRRREVA